VELQVDPVEKKVAQHKQRLHYVTWMKILDTQNNSLIIDYQKKKKKKKKKT
jgi:hypothetical protein